MKLHHALFISLLAIAFASAENRQVGDKPNILFIMVDDLGKEWVKSYGAEDIETPNIDRLASGGMQFNNAWCMPQCTPTRASLLTGQYPFRHGWVNHWDVPRWGGGCSFDPKRNPSIGLVMKSAGYATAAAGKWQIDDFRQEPTAMVDAGFDDYFMWTGFEAGNAPSGKRYADAYIYSKAGAKTHAGKFGPDLYTDFLIDFMRKNKQYPMFLYFPMALTHGPLTATPLEPEAKSKIEKHKAMVRYTDHLLGRLVKELDDLGIRKNTIVVWTTDNGSGGVKGKMNGRIVPGGKAKTTENGICVPFIANCPGLVPAGVKTDALIDFTDLLPTFADIGGGGVPTAHTIDGKSFRDHLVGKADDSKREWILSMGGRNEARLTTAGVENKYWFRDRVLRDKRFKLFVGTDRKPQKLYDLIADPVERENLLGSDDELAKAAVTKFMAVVDTMPERDSDPIYDPLPHQPWFKKAQGEPLKWKVGYPERN